MKANFLDGERMCLADHSVAESERHMALLATDVREAAVAFLERRPPEFKGR
jgi:hypothetical protein